MEIDDSVDWDINKSVGAVFVRGNNGIIDCYLCAEVGSGDDEGV